MLRARLPDGTLSYADFITEFPVVQTLIRHWRSVGLGATTCRQLLDSAPRSDFSRRGPV
ncbi:MAG TPA: hypothetical protein VHP83_09660 [Aggregatilineaceae bacterium]|nr:hypothetical protein [Aggregatilineaceae bacterium]